MQIDYLNEQLTTAEQARASFLETMGSDYSAPNLARLGALQQQLDDAQARLDAATAANNTEGSNGNGASPAVAASPMCIVTLIRNGKSDRCLEVRSDSTVADLIHTLNTTEPNGGWEPESLTIKRRVGPGQTADITDPANTTLGEGPHEIWIGKKVAGGSI